MFNLFGKKKAAPVPLSIRDTLFGDMPLAQWPNDQASSPNQEPWVSFAQARDALNKGKKDEAILIWQQIAAMPGLESRHYLQAWYFLRQQGVLPRQDKAKILYGVVVEVGMPKGLDLLAAYPGGQAHYYNFSGAAVIWERPNASLDDTINAVLDAGRQIVVLIGP